MRTRDRLRAAAPQLCCGQVPSPLGERVRVRGNPRLVTDASSVISLPRCPTTLLRDTSAEAPPLPSRQRDTKEAYSRPMDPEFGFCVFRVFLAFRVFLEIFDFLCFFS
jgi:hypothetical protein